MRGFRDSRHTMVITLEEIIGGKEPILYVTHDEEDGMWQFLNGSKELDPVCARVVSLKEILMIDASLDSIGDLPLGWIAERKNINSKWQRRKG